MSIHLRTLALGAALALSIGCGPKQGGTYDVGAASGSANAAEALIAEADALWERRSDKAALQEALQKYEQAYTADPRNRYVAKRLTRGYYFLADAHVPIKERKLATYDTAINWGKRCMAINDEFKAKIDAGEKEETAVAASSVEDVSCIYWTASALGKWAKGYGIAKALKHKDTIVAYITRVGELKPEFFHGAADRYWGAYYSVLPSFAGQDLPKSRQHFEKSIRTAPDYLGTKVLMAENYAVKSQDRQLFDKLLADVLAADPNSVPELAPENKSEQAKAEALKAKADELFR